MKMKLLGLFGIFFIVLGLSVSVPLKLIGLFGYFFLH